MVNNVSVERSTSIHRRSRRLKRSLRARAKIRARVFSIKTLLIITITALLLARNYYISVKSTDLSYAVEYNFTRGLISKNKLLRVQKMSLIYSDGETAIVEASGLSKNEPHKSVSITGNFKKDSHKSWYLENIQQ